MNLLLLSCICRFSFCCFFFCFFFFTVNNNACVDFVFFCLVGLLLPVKSHICLAAFIGCFDCCTVSKGAVVEERRRSRRRSRKKSDKYKTIAANSSEQPTRAICSKRTSINDEQQQTTIKDTNNKDILTKHKPINHQKSTWLQSPIIDFKPEKKTKFMIIIRCKAYHTTTTTTCDQHPSSSKCSVSCYNRWPNKCICYRSLVLTKKKLKE